MDKSYRARHDDKIHYNEPRPRLKQKGPGELNRLGQFSCHRFAVIREERAAEGEHSLHAAAIDPVPHAPSKVSFVSASTEFLHKSSQPSKIGGVASDLL